MDALNKAASQLIALIRSMTPGARVAAGVLVLAIGVSLTYLVRHQSSTADAYLMGGEPFGIGQLTTMEAAFAKAGLSNYNLDGGRVRVPRGQQYAYMAALADAGALPPSFGKYLERAVASTSAFMGKKQQEEMIKVAKQHELQEVICKMKGIELASVLYEVQERRGFGQENITTASVNVKPLGSQALDEDQVPLLRHLVASAIGMKPESVTVTDLNGHIYPAGSAASAQGGGLDDLYMSKKKAFERDWVSKITNALAYIPGVMVSANVELDNEMGREVNTIEPASYDAKQDSAKGAAPGGAFRFGFIAEQPGANQGATIGASRHDKADDEPGDRPRVHSASQRSTRVTQQGMIPKRVTVTVAIPNSYYTKVWSERHPAAPGQPRPALDPRELAAIESRVTSDVENAVLALLPLDAERGAEHPRVKVTSFQPIAPLPPVVPDFSEKTIAWLGQYWSTLGVVALAVACLSLLRSMIKTPLIAAPAVESSFLPEPELADEQPEQPARSRTKRRGATSPALRDELADMVRDDPDSAVSVLRTWIGNAS